MLYEDSRIVVTVMLNHFEIVSLNGIAFCHSKSATLWLDLFLRRLDVFRYVFDVLKWIFESSSLIRCSFSFFVPLYGS